MKVIICLDDNNGMMFNKRRQSRDAVVMEKIMEITKSSKLWISRYSVSIFKDLQINNINVDESFVLEASEGEYCFVEDICLKNYEKWIEEITVFRWNRVYPNDFKFDINLSAWKLVESFEFRGNSHDKITMEVYVK